MANDWFEFKKFIVRQQEAAMKVGTDGVLLGAWTPIESGVKKVLDIGTGTGLVALMMAQRLRQSMGERHFIEDTKRLRRVVSDPTEHVAETNQVKDSSDIEVVGIEIDAKAANQARQNVRLSMWAQQITIINDDVCRWSMSEDNSERFDLIVSNPPYFVNSLNSPVLERNMARHTDMLSFDNLILSVVRLLSSEGLFSVILPFDVRGYFVGMAIDSGLELVRETVVYAKRGVTPKRVLMVFKRSSCKHQPCTVDDLTIRDADDYSERYKRLTSEFYINF